MITDDIKPHKGRQTEFLESDAFLVVFGGSAGGGKSMALLLDAFFRVAYAEDRGVPLKYVIFRRTYSQITLAGGLWEMSKSLFYRLEGVPKETSLRWDFPCGSTVTFAHVQYNSDISKFQGSSIDCMGFDELGTFTDRMFWDLKSRVRSSSYKQTIIKPYIRATCNPHPNSWLSDLLQWYWDAETGDIVKERDGLVRYFQMRNNKFVWGNSEAEVRKLTGSGDDVGFDSFQFISARVDDNPTLMKSNPEYKRNLESLRESERRRMLEGNWLLMVESDYFKDARFGKWDEKRECNGYVDPAYSGKDCTALTLGYYDEERDVVMLTGWSWRKSIVDLYETISSLAESYKCGTLYIESNADKGLSLLEMAKHYPAVQEDVAKGNKHNRIISYLYKWWGKVELDLRCDKKYISQIMQYHENCGQDDAPDSAAGFIKTHFNDTLLMKRYEALLDSAIVGNEPSRSNSM